MRISIGIAILGLAIAVTPAAGQFDTTFTFQGKLLDNGDLADGLYNVSFSLWDANGGGSQVGSTIGPFAIGVFDGLLTRRLDFGGAAFDNSDRWLEVTVNGVPLSPRQLIARAPYAMQTRGIFVSEDQNFVGVGRSSAVTASEVFGIYRDTSTFGGMYVQTSSSDGLPYYGYSAGGNVDAFHHYNQAEQDWKLTVNGVDVISVGKHQLGLGTVDGLKVDNGFLIASSAFLTDDLVVVGDVDIIGTLTKAAGSFRIDHPLDPDNKYLSHSFVESPDMMNIYNGNVVTSDDGVATVELPDYFDALNRDFRYQLTVIGEFAQAIIAEKISGNRFVIRTDKPRVEVSWQVTGIRDDAYARKHPIVVEQEKPDHERGARGSAKSGPHGPARPVHAPRRPGDDLR